MMQENSLSADQMTTVLEDAPIVIHVSAVDDWAPLYANQQARELGLPKPASSLLWHRDGAASTLRWATDEPHGVYCPRAVSSGQRQHLRTAWKSSPTGTAELHKSPT